MKLLHLSVLSLLLFYNITKKSNLKGKVVDKTTGEELVGVKVILNKKDTTYTDFEGKFKLPIPDGINVLEIEYISYGKETIEIIK